MTTEQSWPQLVESSESSSDAFRKGMRKFAASVTVITTVKDGVPHGMTATAFSSVAADPPTILVVINQTARTHPLIDASGVFAVNLLNVSQRHLANQFSAKHPNQFEGIEYFNGPKTQAPIFQEAASFLECRLTNRIDVETHTVFFGRVLTCETNDRAPLLYYCGGYHNLAMHPNLELELSR